jgi:hypothetical protein
MFGGQQLLHPVYTNADQLHTLSLVHAQSALHFVLVSFCVSHAIAFGMRQECGAGKRSICALWVLELRLDVAVGTDCRPLPLLLPLAL